jgi:hypothetical protein|tara:strand:+ start:4864 stop:5637 length:774 start_codon:yes stop_codon:yes gene_type:complete
MDVFSESSQTTDTTQPEIQTTESTPPQDSFVQKLVEAKGENWKNPEVLAKGKLEADGYIQELETQLNSMREDLSKQDYAKTLLDQLQNKAAESTTANTVTPKNNIGDTSDGNTNPNLSEEDLKSLVERTLTERDKDSVVKQNLNLVNEEMEKSYGTDASAKIHDKAKELGLTIERMQEIAAESPTAFFNLIGELKKDFKPMVQGSVRTEGVNMQASSERDWSYYQNLRRDNRSLYYTPKIQRQLMEDKNRLGGKFGI